MTKDSPKLDNPCFLFPIFRMPLFQALHQLVRRVCQQDSAGVQQCYQEPPCSVCGLYLPGKQANRSLNPDALLQPPVPINNSLI